MYHDALNSPFQVTQFQQRLLSSVWKCYVGIFWVLAVMANWFVAPAHCYLPRPTELVTTKDAKP